MSETLVFSPQEIRLHSEQKNTEYRTERIAKIVNSISESKSRVDIERAKYFTESFKTTEGKPLILRWAKALYHVAENISVYIDENQ